MQSLASSLQRPHCLHSGLLILPTAGGGAKAAALLVTLYGQGWVDAVGCCGTPLLIILLKYINVAQKLILPPPCITNKQGVRVSVGIWSNPRIHWCLKLFPLASTHNKGGLGVQIVYKSKL